ncbi:hypothetical protein [Nonomuraea basaltis]|uniref:hypothetical protein n=1 Tax=Nonomuraea basaltis TaxID=2495887 RepID=UPI00110C5AAE|nr:hypothetical protein [Nonomuraea basaltis]TMR92633.1 hypothetical protein EJK15_43630 [Nonomuraea basaltis]
MNVAGFTSAIIPNYLDPPTDPARWGWWRHDRGWWATASALLDPRASGAVAHERVFVFDEDGTSEH